MSWWLHIYIPGTYPVSVVVVVAVVVVVVVVVVSRSFTTGTFFRGSPGQNPADLASERVSTEVPPQIRNRNMTYWGMMTGDDWGMITGK